MGQVDDNGIPVTPDYTLVPQNQRNEFRLKFRTSIGGEVQKKLKNSDIIFLNYFYYRLKDGEYTTHA